MIFNLSVPSNQGDNMYLFKNGDQCAYITGGWRWDSSTLYKAEITDCISVSSTNSGSVFFNVTTKNKIDLTGMSKLCINVTERTLTIHEANKPIRLGIYQKSSNGSITMLSAMYATVTEIGVTKYDIPAHLQNGNYCIGFAAMLGSGTFKADKIWCE